MHLFVLIYFLNKQRHPITFVEAVLHVSGLGFATWILHARIMCARTINDDSQTEDSSKLKDSVVELIGEWGPWQQRTVFLIFLCKIPAAFFMACIIFTAPFASYGEFHCKQPTNTGLSAANFTEWMKIAHPTTENDQFDFCQVYEHRTEALFDWQQQQKQQHIAVPQSSITGNCDAFEHHSIFRSLVTEFDLVCSRTILIAVTQFFHLCGVLMGNLNASFSINT